MEASGSVRVGVHLANASNQVAAGLAALLTGAPKDSFASLLGAGDTVQPESGNTAPLKRKQGDRDDGASQDRKQEHAHKTKSSKDDVGSATEVGPKVTNAIGVLPESAVRPDEPDWRTNPDVKIGGGSDGRIEQTAGLWVERSAVGSGSASGFAVAPSDESKGDGSIESPNGLAAAEGVMQVNDRASDTKIQEAIHGPRVPDFGLLNGMSTESQPDASKGNVQSSDVDSRNHDATSAVVESSTGVRFTSAVTVRGTHQSGGSEPAQLTNQSAAIGSGPRDEAERMPARVRGADSSPTIPTVGQSEARGGQAHHDTSAQALKAEQVAGASPRTADGPAVELVKAGQADATERSSVQKDGTSATLSAPAEPSPRQDVMPHALDADTSKILANAMRGELHVGLHTEAFGRVTIQTSTSPGQFSAQVSLEDPKQGAALAAHLPAVEQSILQRHGVDASVRILSEPQTGSARNSAGNGQRDSGANDGARGGSRSARAFAQRVERTTSLSAGVSRDRWGWNPLRGRLDVTV